MTATAPTMIKAIFNPRPEPEPVDEAGGITVESAGAFLSRFPKISSGSCFFGILIPAPIGGAGIGPAEAGGRGGTAGGLGTEAAGRSDKEFPSGGSGAGPAVGA